MESELRDVRVGRGRHNDGATESSIKLGFVATDEKGDCAERSQPSATRHSREACPRPRSGNGNPVGREGDSTKQSQSRATRLKAGPSAEGPRAPHNKPTRALSESPIAPGSFSKQPNPLTRRQRDTLDFIQSFVAENGFPPTVRDICLGLGLSSTQTAHAHLHKLEEKGFIRLGQTHRSLQVVPRPGRRALDLIPLAGRVAAGAPLLATENLEGYLDLGTGLAGETGDRFALKVRGDSMVEAGIVDGDYIVVRLQQTAENGDIVVALIGDEATVKFFFREEDRIRLQPANSSMEPIYLKDVAIIGKVLASFRAYEPGSFLQGTEA